MTSAGPQPALRPASWPARSALGRLNRDLWRLVGDPMYEELRQGIAIEQAVDMAWGGFQMGQN